MSKEQYKYKKIYEKRGVLALGGKVLINHTYGNNRAMDQYFDFLLAKKPSSIIDVGCGQNRFCNKIKKLFPHIRCIGVDFASPKADKIAEAIDLPFEDKEFELLTALDVLEHIPENEIDEVLNEFKRVSNNFFYIIISDKSKLTIDGENLHPLVKKPIWWIQKIKEHKGLIITKWVIIAQKRAHGIALYGTFNKNDNEKRI